MLLPIASLLHPSAQIVRQVQPDKSQNDRFEKSAATFESLLFTNWLQNRVNPVNRPGGLPMVPSIAERVSSPTQLFRKVESEKTQNDKIEKSAADFESLLLTNWLQGAQESFASVPGGDEEADADPGRGQLQGFAMQSLGTALTASGGIGLAHSITQLLRKSEAVTPRTAPISVTPG